MPQIILASSSIYRKELLNRLLLEFKIVKPDVKEVRLESETAYNTADRLAEEKAKKVSIQFKDAIIIGCDQTAEYSNIQIQKPLNFKTAVSQLKKLSGKRVNFHSAICVNFNKKKIFQKKLSALTLNIKI